MASTWSFCEWVLKSSWQASLLIGLIFLLRLALGKKLTPFWTYTLWLLVLVRLAIPILPASSASAFNLVPATVDLSTIVPQVPAEKVTAAPPVTPAMKEPPRVEVPADGLTTSDAHAPVSFLSVRTLFWIWLSVAAVLLLMVIRANWRLGRTVGEQRLVTNSRVLEILEDCRQIAKVRVPVVLVQTPAISSPALFGFLRPRLLLPDHLIEQFSVDELRFIFLHELAHIKRGDIVIGWVATLLQIVHWFNPLIWIGFAQMRVDRELACDSLALSFLREDEDNHYGRTIIKLLEGFAAAQPLPGVAGILEEKKQVERRIAMIAQFRVASGSTWLSVALMALLMVTTLTNANVPARVSAPIAAKTASPARPVNLWHGEGDAQDAIGNAPGKTHNGTGFTTGKTGQCFDFDGVDDYVAFNPKIGNFGTNDFTMAFWIRTVTKRGEYVLGKRFICNNGSYWNITMSVKGIVSFAFDHDSAGVYARVLSGSKLVNDGVFHHIALTRAGNTISLYIDGALDQVLNGPFVYNFANEAAMMAGAIVCTGIDGSNFFQGQLDELAFYDRALSSSEIATLLH